MAASGWGRWARRWAVTHWATGRTGCSAAGGAGAAVISGLGCSACNTAFVGLPIVESLFPGNTEALVVAGLMTLTPNVVVILGQVRLDLLNGVTAWEEGQSRAWILFRALVLGNPILLSTVAGLALAVSGSGLWAPLDRACALVGFTAAPCMLVSLWASIWGRSCAWP